MKLTCIIVEDQPPAQRVLEKYIKDLGTLELRGVFSDALTALEFLKREKVDIMFLDIHLPKLSGIELLKILNPKPKVILTTAFSEYAIEGYELDVVDYLLKPFSFERFVKAVTKATSIVSSEAASNIEKQASTSSKEYPKQIFVKSGNEYIHLNIDDIRYINADGDYTMIYMVDKKYLVSHPLRYWLTALPEELFSQVHKSYIVNIQSITKVVSGQILLGETKIPVGRTYKDAFSKKYLV